MLQFLDKIVYLRVKRSDSAWFMGSFILARKVKVAELCPTLCNPMDYTLHGILQARLLEWVAVPFSRESSQPWDQTQAFPHCRQILYQLSHQGSPRILEWAAYPFSSGSSQPRNWTRVYCIADRFFTNWAMREAHFGPENLCIPRISAVCWKSIKRNTKWNPQFSFLILQFKNSV